MLPYDPKTVESRLKTYLESVAYDVNKLEKTVLYDLDLLKSMVDNKSIVNLSSVITVNVIELWLEAELGAKLLSHSMKDTFYSLISNRITSSLLAVQEALKPLPTFQELLDDVYKVVDSDELIPITMEAPNEGDSTMFDTKVRQKEFANNKATRLLPPLPKRNRLKKYRTKR